MTAQQVRFVVRQLGESTRRGESGLQCLALDEARRGSIYIFISGGKTAWNRCSRRRVR